MAYRELVQGWHKGVLALEKGDWESALSILGSIESPSSKIHFNKGCIYLMRGDLESALEAFDRTVSKDRCLAVGFYQRGYVCLRLERYEEALNDFRLALTHLRNNTCIDYKQLGMKVVLCAWEVLYNIAVAHCRLGKWPDGQQMLEEARRQAPQGQMAYLDAALEQVEERFLLEPRSLPRGEVFRPPKKDVEELEAKDFLGQPKVISSAFEEEGIGGSCGLQPQGCYNPGADPSCEQAHGYHRLVAPYSPEKATALKEGSVVYVLSTGGGACATCIYKGQKICIPASHLRPTCPAAPGKGEVGSGLPPPPGKVPPNRPHERPRGQLPERAAGSIDANGTSPKMAPKVPLGHPQVLQRSCRPTLLQVQGSYTVNVKLSAAPSLADLRVLLQEECCRQAAQVLRYRSPGSDELIPVSSDEELQTIWQEAEGGQLTLWCQGSASSAERPVLYRMVAHHPYAAQGLEDLNFKEGDKLEILAEVNEEWLEGRCDGIVGIFPKCFAEPEDADGQS